MNNQPQNEKLNFVLSEEEVDEWFEEEISDEESFALSDEELSKKYSESQLRVVRSTLDFTLHTLKSALADPNYINLSPNYQRRGRWDRKKRSLLIESFLLNMPIPPLFLFENDYNQYEVMDGRQRLETINQFLENSFPLSELEYWPELKGRRFNDLPNTIQRGLLRRTISAIVLLAETDRDQKSDFDIRMVLFRRLNTGGANLNPQELRNALYTGSFNDLLHELSRDKLFTSIWNIPPKTQDEEKNIPTALENNNLFKSMMDCELVLRFFAIRDTVEGNVKGSLKQILDKTMQKNRSIPKTQINSLRSLFTNSMQQLINALGNDFIILPDSKRPSRPLFDALMVACSLNPQIDLSLNAESIRKKLNTSLGDKKDYEILVGRGNTVEAIKDRVSLASRILYN